nr:retrovirus-related Pol polyprotein from transposon TNT 1-94 [Tanacetum cinerariifolium]
AVATACYTKNCSLIHTRHHKTPYELVHNKKPDLTLFRVFGALCYPTNESEDLGKLQPTADTGIFIGYAPSRKGYRIYNKRTRPEPHFMEDHNVAPVDNNPFVNVFAPEPHSEASSSGDISSTESRYVSQTFHHLNKWSKDHPLENVIGNPSRPVSTQKQLATDALWCLYSSILSKIEPKNFKYAIIKDY